MTSFLYLEESLDDILNAVAFARLKMLHNSIINPMDLVNSLQQIPQSLQKYILPLPIQYSTIAKYIDLIVLEAFQLDAKIIFAIKYL